MPLTLREDSVNQPDEKVLSILESIKKTYLLDAPVSHKSDRRETERYNLTMPIWIIQDAEQVHHGVSRDISPKGIGLVTSDPIRPGIVKVMLESCCGASFDIAARVTYCNEVGYYFQVGCEFLNE